MSNFWPSEPKAPKCMSISPDIFKKISGLILLHLGVFGSDGQKMDPFWFDPKRTIDQVYYIEVLQNTVLPWIKSTYEARGIPYVWQQGAIHI